ncbi:MAG: T9SS type A sorting domain-containing protein, partial [Calditrichia bacterium]|nr:T9SS type A sorting domain-containing protein [Calditrichia bacterium]
LFAEDIHTNGIVGIEDPVASALPAQYELLGNYPNPFNPSTTIEFNLPKASNIRLTIYNMVGQEVAVLMDNFMPAGNHKVKFKAEELPSGMYLYRLETAGKSFARKMLLMK